MFLSIAGKLEDYDGGGGRGVGEWGEGASLRCLFEARKPPLFGPSAARSVADFASRRRRWRRRYQDQGRGRRRGRYLGLGQRRKGRGREKGQRRSHVASWATWERSCCGQEVLRARPLWTGGTSSGKGGGCSHEEGVVLYEKGVFPFSYRNSCCCAKVAGVRSQKGFTHTRKAVFRARKAGFSTNPPVLWTRKAFCRSCTREADVRTRKAGSCTGIEGVRANKASFRSRGAGVCARNVVFATKVVFCTEKAFVFTKAGFVRKVAWICTKIADVRMLKTGVRTRKAGVRTEKSGFRTRGAEFSYQESGFLYEDD